MAFKKTAKTLLALPTACGIYEIAYKATHDHKPPLSYTPNMLSDNFGFTVQPFSVLMRLVQVGVKVPAFLLSPSPHHLSTTLINLGPAWIKLGQQLSIRPDVVPPDYLDALSQLHDNCPSFSDEVAMGIIESSLKSPISSSFRGPLRLVAAASLGQVYKGTLSSTGEDVAVKVQRPGIEKSVGTDLYIARLICTIADNVVPMFTEQKRMYVDLCDVFSEGSWGELDYEREGRNQMFFKEELEKRGVEVHIPTVHSHLHPKSSKIIITSWVHGTKLSDCPPSVINNLIPVGVELFLTQLLDIGKFHSDPHPGNLLVIHPTPDSNPKLSLIDFGLVATVDRKERKAMTGAIVNLLKGDFELLIRRDAKELGFLSPNYDTTPLEPHLTRILREGLKNSTSNLLNRRARLSAISSDLNEVFFRHDFTVPPFFALVTRGLGILEGIALKGDEEFDIFKASMPYAKRRAKVLFGYKE